MAALAASDVYINLLTAGATVTRGDAVFVQGGVAAGTGNFDPFLTLSPGGNADTEKGYNTTSASGEFDTFFGGGRTHPIKASAIPAIVDPPGVPAGTYREFSLDANDQGADDFMSIDRIRVYLDTQNNLTGYNIATEVFSSDVTPFKTKIYDMDGGAGDNAAVLMRSQTLTPGSGVSDITVLLKDSIFPADCFYGSTTCDKFLYFYSESGFERTDPPDSLTGGVDRDFNVTAGFEEWRTRLLPVVAVSKTANTSFDRRFDWTVQKLVSTDDDCLTGFIDANTAGTGLDINLFNGQSDTVCWQIISDRGPAQDSNIQLSGTITIVNPTGPGQPIEDPIPATINTVSDIVAPGGAAAVVCPVSFPFTLAAGATLTCTYSKALSSSDPGTNTASAVVENGTTDLTYSSAAVPFDPSSGTINVEDENASLDDSRTLPGAPVALSGDDTRTYTEVLSCPSTRTESNTATLTETDTNTSHTDPAFVNITCNTLSVSKTANTSFNRTFDWTVQKLVSTDDSCATGFLDANDVASALVINLFNGQSDTVCWKIISLRGDAQDSGFAVTGTITITNGATIPANGVSVSDQLTGPIAATVDCDPAPGNQTTVNVPASSSVQCSYSASLPDATTRTNTATASLAGQSYTGTAQAVFDSSTPTTETDDTASLDDSRVPGLPGAPVPLSDDDTRTYTEALSCGSDRNETNTATLTEDDSLSVHTDPAVVKIDCHGLTVTKNATTSFTRTFDWTVQKLVSTDDGCATGFVDGTLSITLDVGQSDTVCWKIVSDRGAAQDSGFAVNGTITIQNDAPIAAMGVAVSDLITPGDIAGTVDCDPGAGTSTTVDVPASSSATCTYSAVLPNTDTRTNTAKASLAGNDYTGTADVIFGAPTTIIDESATLDDSRSLPGAPVGLSGDDTRTYTEVLPCGESRTESNLATLTEDDTSQIHTDPAAVELTCVPVGEGCTPGFWKNHKSLWDGQGANDVTTIIQTTDFFNATFGVAGTMLSGMTDARNLLYALAVTTPTLDFAGDPDLAALDRHAAAALVNADATGVDYAFTVTEVIEIYQDAVGFIAGTETISSALATLSTENERGCPLS